MYQVWNCSRIPSKKVLLKKQFSVLCSVNMEDFITVHHEMGHVSLFLFPFIVQLWLSFKHVFFFVVNADPVFFAVQRQAHGLSRRSEFGFVYPNFRGFLLRIIYSFYFIRYCRIPWSCRWYFGLIGPNHQTVISFFFCCLFDCFMI